MDTVSLVTTGRVGQHLDVRLKALVRALDTRDVSGPASAHEPDNDEMPKELPVGAPAPRFELPDLSGATVSLDDHLIVGKSTLLVIGDPTCGPCGQLLQELPVWQTTPAETHEIVLVSRGGMVENRAKPGMLNMRRVLLQRDRELSFVVGILGTPSAVLVQSEGTIGSPVAGGIQPVRTLLATVGQSA